MLALGTRFFDKREDEISINSSRKKVLDFVNRSMGLADTTIVAINEEEDKSGAKHFLASQNMRDLMVLGVKPWGFCSAMNALIYQADLLQQDYLLSCSVEIAMTPKVVEEMMAHMDPTVLCVGARLPDHKFYPGKLIPGDGSTIPWNTCVLWNLRRLATTGFFLIGDASFDKTQAGVEELTTMSLLQKLYPDETRIKLVEIEGVEWRVDFGDDPARRAAHEHKMRKKIQRPLLQLGFLGLLGPKVEHIGR